MSALAEFREMRRALGGAAALLRRMDQHSARGATGATGATDTARELIGLLRVAVARAHALETAGHMDRAEVALHDSRLPTGTADTGRRADLRAALEGLGSVPRLSGCRTRAVTRVIVWTAHVADLDADTLRGAGRTAGVVRARQLAMLLAAALTGAPLAAIGAALGGRDHTTLHHGIKRAKERLAVCDDTALMAMGVLEGLAADAPVGMA